MTNSDTSPELEQQLAAFFRTNERVSPEAISTAKSLFDLRRIDDELAELQDELSVAARGPADVPLRFQAEGTDIIVSISPGEVMVIVAPRPESVALLSGDEERELELDQAGGATVMTSGVHRLRVRRDGQPDVVTEAFRVPPAVS